MLENPIHEPAIVCLDHKDHRRHRIIWRADVKYNDNVESDRVRALNALVRNKRFIVAAGTICRIEDYTATARSKNKRFLRKVLVSDTNGEKHVERKFYFKR